jgi:predicted Zn-dependent protease
MGFEHSGKRVAAEVGILVVAVGLLGWGLWAGARWAADWGARRVPVSVDRALGDAMAKAVSIQERPAGGPEVGRAVEALARQLAETAGPEEIGPLTVKVWQDTTPNAFALPGGHVFVLTGLLDKAESVDEVAGVLGHELGHVVLRHHVRRAVRELGVLAALGAVFGDLDTLTAVVVGGGADLLGLAYGREQEEAADAYGVQLMARAGYDPPALGRFLERLESAELVPDILRTHPSGGDRRHRLESLAEEHPRNAAARPPAEVTLEALRGGPPQEPPR